MHDLVSQLAWWRLGMWPWRLDLWCLDLLLDRRLPLLASFEIEHGSEVILKYSFVLNYYTSVRSEQKHFKKIRTF